ncbi:MAG: hemerythrin domain-containing protein [Pseudomonadota bacterium]|nr:hemerythrin domain-containing protein [Gammaproteobacteria bacterium]MBU1731289.1 hemerythrin domain-containing protein [Gammaproteobacteria bacterium]MBU1892794.1 hemerythrin domain-containing protein [Gammaproteobacteria bacterium]
MSSISAFLTPDHQHCDTFFAAAETAAGQGDWRTATEAWTRFHDALRHHFAMEEEVLFPAFEARTGMTQGPTQMMRMEHRQMSDLLNQLADAVVRQDSDAFLGDCETLLIIMQQHNMKEEQMLYLMADQVLAGEADSLVGRMRAISE